jgi:hypothetical protein
MVTIKEHANAELLIKGDVIAIYAGNEEPSHTATVESVSRLPGTVVIHTTCGMFDLALDDRVAVIRWAPLGEVL